MRAEDYIERFLQTLFLPGDTVEIRALQPGQPPRLLATDVFREAAAFVRIPVKWATIPLAVGHIGAKRRLTHKVRVKWTSLRIEGLAVEIPLSLFRF